MRHLVEGSFRQAGTRLRIGLQLVETDAGRLVWNPRFEGAREDIFTLQDQITEQVCCWTTALTRHRIHPALLTCEITKTAPMEDTGATQEIFRRLGELGHAPVGRQTRARTRAKGGGRRRRDAARAQDPG